MTGGRRADARRNHDRILAVARDEVAAHGAAASLEQIARVAGVGSATVRRHFPTRGALLEAVSHERVEALAAYAREALDAPDPTVALLAWTDELVAYCVVARGLAPALSGADLVHGNSCAASLGEALDPLLARAVRAGGVTADLTAPDLITVVVGIVLAVEHRPDPRAEATRLVGLAFRGVRAQPTGVED
ncbi:TetR/AcrR family transcriptional regulator [Pseudonocardia sp. ICBG1293]|uniref:TetR/AcrR family transcriptional regulator n=1 Tax=Pseudonocardia sp. ICBG1293 TaxID=2844382 RepID=UPI001CCDA34E|nr:TetR/AcrR family transcriptional regulator [Pseudonocardia sp. ICBG1293]